MNDKVLLNRHPVDLLAHTRALIKNLQEREADLKGEVIALMGDRDSLGGDEFLAHLSQKDRKGGLDEKKLADRLGDLSAYRKPGTSYPELRLEPRAVEE
jgi:hypothetical protein